MTCLPYGNHVKKNRLKTPDCGPRLTPLAGVRPTFQRSNQWKEWGVSAVRSLVRFMACFLPRAGGKFHQQVWTGNAILLRCPRAEVDQLAAFRAEGTPRIAFPGSWLTAERAGHSAFYHMSEVAGSARTNRIGSLGLQKAVQAILIDFRQAKELNSELSVSAPANRGRFDSDGRAQVCRTDENTDS